MTTTAPPAEADYKVADLGLADFGRKEITLAEHEMPGLMSIRKEYAEAGSLMSYGSPIRDNYRRAAVYVDRILRGEKPAGLPAEPPTEYELIVNRKAADALGIVVPASVLRRAVVI